MVNTADWKGLHRHADDNERVSRLHNGSGSEAMQVPQMAVPNCLPVVFGTSYRLGDSVRDHSAALSRRSTTAPHVTIARLHDLFIAPWCRGELY